MATTTNPPTQNAAIAQYITGASRRTDGEKLYQDAVQEILKDAGFQNMDPRLVDRITTARNVEDIVQNFDDEQARSRVWKGESRSMSWKSAGAIFSTYTRFKSALELFAQSSPSIVLPIYASVCLIAIIAKEVLGTQEILDKFQDRLFPCLDRFKEHIYGKNIGVSLRKDLVKFYGTIIRFCLKASVVLSRGRTVTSLKAVGKSVKAPFDDLMEQLAKAEHDVIVSVQLEAFSDGKDRDKRAAFATTGQNLSATVTQRIIGVPALLSQHFTGRALLISSIKTYLGVPSGLYPTRAVLWGIPGVGKTQVLLSYLHENENTYSYVIFVRASSKDIIYSEYRKIASSLHLTDDLIAAKDESLLVEKVKGWFSENQGWLLIFDNVQDSNEVLTFAPASGRGHILFSTRNEVTGVALAKEEGCFHVQPLSLIDAKDLVLRLASVLEPYSDSAIQAAADIADFSSRLPIAIEQLVRLAQLSQLDLPRTLSKVRHRRNLLRQSHPASFHEDNLSCGALLLEALDEVAKLNEGANALFKLLVYLGPSSIPIGMVIQGASELDIHFSRNDTFDPDRGLTQDKQMATSRPLRRQSFHLLDHDPFERETWLMFLHVGKYRSKYTRAVLPRVDSVEDKSLRAVWTSSSILKHTILDDLARDRALNILAKSGLIRRMYDKNEVWIHDLYADMGTAIDQEELSKKRAHLASTMVYLAFHVPMIPTPFEILDECLLYLPSAIRSLHYLAQTGTFNDATVGPELSHLVASTIHARGMMMSTLYPSAQGRGGISSVIHYYKLALTGYVHAHKRLQADPNVKQLDIVLATVADQSEEEVYNGYLPRRRYFQYQRFGRSTAWRCISTALNLGELLTINGDLDDALKFVQLAVEMAKQIFGSTHQETIDAVGVLQDLYETRGEFEEAYEAAESCAKRFMGWEEKTGEYKGSGGLIDSEQGARFAGNLGRIASILQWYERAVWWYQTSFLAVEKIFGGGSPQASTITTKLVECYEKMGDMDAAGYWRTRATLDEDF